MVGTTRYRLIVGSSSNVLDIHTWIRGILSSLILDLSIALLQGLGLG